MINKQKKNGVLITEYLPNIAYFITDYYEKLYDDSLETIVNQSKSLSLGTPSLLTTSPTIMNTPTSTVTPPIANVKKSPPIILKISTRKLEILSAIKQQIGENELCAVLFNYLIIACMEIHDWVNLRVLLPAVRFPENNETLFEKWFMYHFLHMLSDKQIVEQFNQDWFVSLIFDEFLFVLLEQKDNQLALSEGKQMNHVNSLNNLFNQMYKLIDKIYPVYLSPTSFLRIIETLKPRKYVSVTFFTFNSTVDSEL